MSEHEQDRQTNGFDKQQPRRRGIIPFENGFTPRERENFGPYTSTTFLTAAGNMFVVLEKYSPFSIPEHQRGRKAYAVFPNGELVEGTEENFCLFGFAALKVLVEPFDLDNAPEEVERKGEFDCLIQVTDNLFLRGSNRFSGPGNPLAFFISTFLPEGQNGDKGLLMIHPDNPLVQGIAVNFTSHMEFEADSTLSD